MIDYVKNIIPRIQQYSKGLDKIEIFVDKPWIYVGDSTMHHQYLFLRDNRLLMTANGITKTGKWELLPTNQLLVDRIEDQIILDHLFVEKALMFLKVFGKVDMPFVLINKDEIPDLNIQKYFEKFQRQKSNEKFNRHQRSPKYEEIYFLQNNDEIHGPEFSVGKKLFLIIKR